MGRVDASEQPGTGERLPRHPGPVRRGALRVVGAKSRCGIGAKSRCDIGRPVASALLSPAGASVRCRSLGDESLRHQTTPRACLRASGSLVGAKVAANIGRPAVRSHGSYDSNLKWPVPLTLPARVALPGIRLGDPSPVSKDESVERHQGGLHVLQTDSGHPCASHRARRRIRAAVWASRPRSRFTPHLTSIGPGLRQFQPTIDPVMGMKRVDSGPRRGTIRVATGGTGSGHSCRQSPEGELAQRQEQGRQMKLRRGQHTSR